MKIITITPENIGNEHICCAISDKKCSAGYEKKKGWLKSQTKNGYIFKKMDVRGKVFIEYVPIEQSWLPLNGKNYMVINCFWVSGQYKGKGNGKKLLQQCIKDAIDSGMEGLVAISSDKKRPFMSDPKFLQAQGFEIVDEAPPFFKLWGLRFDGKGKFPSIKKSAKQGSCPNNGGITAYFSSTCPFTDYYTGQVLKEYAESVGVPITINHLKSKRDAQKMPIPWIINSVFYRGELVTLEMKPQKHLEKLLA